MTTSDERAKDGRDVVVRIEELQGKPVRRGKAFAFSWNEREITAYPGETVLGALLASGVTSVRRTPIRNEPRLMLCGIGMCFDCLVTIDDVPHRQACMTQAQPGMVVRSDDATTREVAGNL